MIATFKDSGEFKLIFFVCFSLALTLLLLPDVSFAKDGPGEDSAAFQRSFETTIPALKLYLNSLVSSGNDLGRMVLVVFRFLSFLLIVSFFINYINGIDFPLEDFIQVLIIITFTKLLLNNYIMVSEEAWVISSHIAETIQTTALATKSPGAFVDFFSAIFGNVFIDTGNNVVYFFMRGLVAFFLSFLVIVFLVGVSFATSWAFWGYLVATIVGYMAVPFFILDSTRWIFMGWLRFFLGFCLYYILARINLVIMLLATMSFFGLVPSGTTFPIDINMDLPVFSYGYKNAEYSGIFVLLIVGILSMFSVGNYTVAIIGGSGSAPSASRLFMSAKFLNPFRK